MLFAGSKLTKEDRESQLYDEFERFKMLPGENIYEYYVCFHKLVNDMRNIRMTMPNIQLNSKFVNNMSPEWDRATLTQTNNQLRASSNTQNQATIQDGWVVIQNVQGRQNQNQRYVAQGNGAASNGGHIIELGMPMQVKENRSSVITVMGLDILQGTVLSQSVDLTFSGGSDHKGSAATNSVMHVLADGDHGSIDQGPFELGTTKDTLGTTPEGGVLLGTERPRTYEDLSDTEKKRYDADVRATNIVLQGLPKDIYKLINHNIEAKAIWDNDKMLLAGSELTKEDRESQLYDEFERFKMLPGENIYEYYVRFHKLVNDIRNIKMTMPNIQLNSKFVNNMSPEWDRFVTAVKLNKGLKETNHEQLYAYLKLHEKHAAQDRLIIERITPATNDQLAFVSTVQPHAQSSNVQSHQNPSSSTNPQSL
ncbi:hypothetical protein Tco_0367010 [Tanacetum coccineum]